MRCRSLLLLTILAAHFSTIGCKSKDPTPGRWVSCTCPYLTDYDDVAQHSLEVCVPEGADIQRVALGCASKLAHGQAEPCKCEPPAGPCDGLKTCQSNEYK